MEGGDTSINEEASNPEPRGELPTGAGEEEELNSGRVHSSKGSSWGMPIPMSRIPGMLEMFAGTSSSEAVDMGDEADGSGARGVAGAASEVASGATAAVAAAVSSESTPAGSNVKPRDEHEAATKKHIIDVLQHALKRWVQHEQKVYEKVKRDLPSRVATVLAESPTKQGLPGSNSGQSSSGALLAAAEELADSVTVCGDGQARPALKPLCASEPPATGRPGKSSVVKDHLERETKVWWSSTVDKIAARMCDSRDGKAFIERCVGTMPQLDAESANVLSDTLRPWRQQIEQHLQAELGPQLAAAAAEQLRAAMRQGGDAAATAHLEAAVNSAMQRAFSTWSDSNIRQAAQRLRAATRGAALSDLAAKDAAQAARDSLQPLSTQVASNSGAPQAGHQAGFTRSLLNQIRLGTQQLDADLIQLAQEVQDARQQIEKCSLSLSQVQTMNAASVGFDAALLAADCGKQEGLSFAATLAAKQTALERLCGEARFEEAFTQALEWDKRMAMHGAAKDDNSAATPLVEWLCEQALTYRSVGGHPCTPEAFLTQDPEPLQSDQLKLSLMAALLSGCISSHASLEHVEQNLEWVVSLQHEFESTASVQQFFVANAVSMTTTLADLTQCRSPPSLSVATSAERQRIVRTARMASKQLELLQRKLR